MNGETKTCTRKGIAWLTVKDPDGSDETIAIPTTCKSKKCLTCRPKLQALFRMTVEYGLKSSTQHRFYFTTLTYKAGKNLQRDADCVRADWRKLLYWFSKEFPNNLTWIRVIELTRAMQPHLHVILGVSRGNNPRASCEVRARYDAEWLSRCCDCMEHRLSAAWNRIVPDSYVVDCTDVSSAQYAASYLAKYVAKGFVHEETFSALGFHRSWSRSRNWPMERLQLLATKQGRWKRTQFTQGHRTSVYPREGSAQWWIETTEQHPLRQRVGTELAFELSHKQEDQAINTKIKNTLELLKNASRQAHNNVSNRPPRFGSSRGMGPDPDGR